MGGCILRTVRRISAQDELADGLEDLPMSAPGPDGLPVPPSGVSRVPPRPRLCEQGPCRHYHRLTIQVDAESPRAVKTPVRLPLVSHMATDASDGGTLYQAPRTFHTEVQHYCYPDTGIETTLGSTPVVECNRWSPLELGEVAESNSARHRFLESLEGQRYLADLKAWEDAREAEAAEAEEIERALADAEAERKHALGALVDAEMARLEFSAVPSAGGRGFMGMAGNLSRDLADELLVKSKEWHALTREYAKSMARRDTRDALEKMAAVGLLPLKKGTENE